MHTPCPVLLSAPQDLGHDLIKNFESGLYGRTVFRHVDGRTSVKIEFVYGSVFGYRAGQFEAPRVDHLQGLFGGCFFDLIDHCKAFTDNDV